MGVFFTSVTTAYKRILLLTKMKNYEKFHIAFHCERLTPQIALEPSSVAWRTVL